MRIKLNNITFNNVLRADIKDNTLIMVQKTPMEGIKEVRIPDVKKEEIQFINKNNDTSKI